MSWQPTSGSTGIRCACPCASCCKGCRLASESLPEEAGSYACRTQGTAQCVQRGIALRILISCGNLAWPLSPGPTPTLVATIAPRAFPR